MKQIKLLKSTILPKQKSSLHPARYFFILLMNKKIFFSLVALLVALQGFGQLKLLESPPRNYMAYRSSSPLVIDGKLDEIDWQHAPWSEYFMDIEGPHVTAPHLKTRVKMLWDDQYFYIAAHMEEPHIWATFTQRESIIFHENNFEVFIDPTGDTHNYYELEINALGTTWDLMLTMPYRFFGIPISAWDIDGLKKGIHINGTLNNPNDTDTSWTVELALPWQILRECSPGRRAPLPGEQWRINFSRVQWRLDVVDGKYQKTINPETGRPYPEYNWVWSPQWAIDMHRPECWGIVQFSASTPVFSYDQFVPQANQALKFMLRELLYLQYEFRNKHQRFANSMKELKPASALLKSLEVTFEAGKTRFKMSVKSKETQKTWHITEDSKIWSE